MPLDAALVKGMITRAILFRKGGMLDAPYTGVTEETADSSLRGMMY